ncbi:major facilitator superfamily domain-containing protein [Aspergillus pseudoustus]|uniref:Major facilitator superfamily domain-containing protein n=1 Tax=Aspergillus pseudoustus TaxID=1810923 RepID=A0ABR4K3J5_9EURO
MDEKTPPTSDAPTEAPQAKPSQHLTGIKLYSIMSAIMIAVFLISLDVSIISTAIPAITSAFHATGDLGWYAAAYPLTMCSLQPLAGKVSAIFPMRAAYLSFFSIFLLGSLLCGVANSSTMFIAARAIAGIGGSGVVSGGLSVIAIVTPNEQRPLFTGLIVSVFSIGTVIAPIIGGAFTSHATWRWCFLINLPTGAITIIVLLLFFHPPKASTSTSSDDKSTPQPQSLLQKLNSLDLPGCAIFVPSIVMVFLALQWGGSKHAWSSATIIGLFVGFGLSICAFIAWELYRGETAMIPFKLLKGRSIVLSICFAFLVIGGYIVPVYYLPEWFQIVRGASPMRSGVMLLPAVLTQVFAAMVSGVLAKHIRYYNPWFLLGSTLVCTANGLYTTFTPSTPTSSTPDSHWIGFQILQGLGTGCAGQMGLLTVQNELKDRPAIIPVGIATVLFAQYFGTSVIQTIAGTVFHNKLVDGLEGKAGLNGTGVAVLLEAGTLKVRETVEDLWPERVGDVVGAYNEAITTVFYVAVAACALAFVLATGIKWNSIAMPKEAKKDTEHGDADKAISSGDD